MNGKKTSIYLKNDVARKLAQASQHRGGETLSISSVTNEAAGLYLDVIEALRSAPSCRVRYIPDGWAIEPEPAPMVA